MNKGNRELDAIKTLLRSTVTKPGGLSKQGIKRLATGFDIGSSVNITRRTTKDLGKDNLAPIHEYNRRREQFPISHANLGPRWFISARPRDDEMKDNLPGRIF